MPSIRGRRYDTGKSVEIVVLDGKVAEVRAIGDGTSTGATVGERIRLPQGEELSSPQNSDNSALPWIAPGFVDLQVNGYGGDEFGSVQVNAAAVARVVERMLTFGVTGFLPTVTTASHRVLQHAMTVIAAACETNERVRRCALGIHLEGPYISRVEGARGAHPLAHCRPPDWDEFQRLQQAAGGRIRLVTLSPEYDEAPAFIRRATESGVVVSLGHTVATRPQTLAAVDAGATMSTHLGNGAQRELPRHPNYLWDQLAEDRLAAGLIVDGCHLPPEVVQTFVRAKAPARCILVSDLSGFAGLPAGEYSTGLGNVEILDDGRLVIAGQRQFLAGASRPIGDGIANVMRFAGVSLATAIEMATSQPLKWMSEPSRGFAVGDDADFVTFTLAQDISRDAGLTVIETWLAGDCVYPPAPA